MTLEGRTLPCGHCSPVQVQFIEFLVTTAHKNYTKLSHSLSMDFVTILSFGPRLPHLFSQSYASILVKNKWLVLIGTKGSFKTMIASHLLRHLSSKLFNTPEKYILFNMDSEGTQVSCVGGRREGGEGRGRGGREGEGDSGEFLHYGLCRNSLIVCDLVAYCVKEQKEECIADSRILLK